MEASKVQSYSQEELELAKSAYHIYNSITNFKTYHGETVPSFDDSPEIIKKAWVQVVRRLANG